MKLAEVLTGDAYIAKHWPIKAYLDQGKIPNKMILKGLAAEAKKAGSYHNFEQDYLGQIKHGLYWHWTNEADFRIDLNKGPRDMSSIGDGQMDPGRLMVTSHLENWAGYGPDGKSRPYVAVIDMSDVPRQAYYQVKRSFGNEFNVSDPSRARVIKVVTPQQAFRIDREQHKWLPQSTEQLLRFYQLATGMQA